MDDWDQTDQDALSPLESDPAAGRHPLRRRTRLLLTITGVALAVAGGTVLTLIELSQSRPGWWRDIDPANPYVADAAQRVENGAATQLTRIRKADTTGPGAGTSEPWTIKLSATDANAWLAARLRPWLESQETDQFKWPRELERIEVRFDGGRIDVGAAVALGQKGGHARFLSASLRPELRSDGGLWMPATSTALGRLSLPTSWTLPRARPDKQRAALSGALAELPQLDDLLDALAGKRPAMHSAVIKIGDGRRVRILGLEPREGALYITCQTLPRETHRAEVSSP